jgi:hypothetical protein
MSGQSGYGNEYYPDHYSKGSSQPRAAGSGYLLKNDVCNFKIICLIEANG